MFTKAELAEHQQDAMETMVDTCKVTRGSGSKGELNPDSLEYEGASEPDTIYAGIFKLHMAGPGPQGVNVTQAAGGTFADMPSRADFPVESPDPSYDTGKIARGDVIEVLTSLNDQALVGRKFTVGRPFHQTWPTARWFPVTEGV